MSSALKKKLIEYSIEKSEKAFNKADWYLKNDYLTDVSSKIYESVFYIILGLAYVGDFVQVPDSDIKNVDLFFMSKGYSNMITYENHKKFANWLKNYTNNKLNNKKIYEGFDHFYKFYLKISYEMFVSLHKEDLVKEVEQAEDLIEIVKQRLLLYLNYT